MCVKRERKRGGGKNGCWNREKSQYSKTILQNICLLVWAIIKTVLKRSLCRCTQLSGTLISALCSSLRTALAKHDPTALHVTKSIVRIVVIAGWLGPVAPDITVAIVEGAAVVAGRRLAVVVGGVHAVRFVYRGLFVRVVEGPRLAFRTIGCVCEVAGVDRTIRGVGVPARRS